MARKTRRHRLRDDRWPTTKITGVMTSGGLVTALTVLGQEWFGVEISAEVAVLVVWLVTSAVGYRLPDQLDRPDQAE